RSFLYLPSHHRYLHSFPTRRSSDLGADSAHTSRSRSIADARNYAPQRGTDERGRRVSYQPSRSRGLPVYTKKPRFRSTQDFEKQDRKSTRLNSSHQIISYAVFCLKK